MDLSFTEEQQVLRETVARFVHQHAPADRITGWYKSGTAFVAPLYKLAAESGFLGMLLPEEYGGSGAKAADCGVILEELGKGPVPGPFFTSGVLAAQLIFDLGTENQRAELLPALCKGTEIIAVAISDGGVDWTAGGVETTAVIEDGAVTLDGIKQFVHDVDGATSVLVAAKISTEGGSTIGLVRVPFDSPGLSVEHLDNGLIFGVSRVSLEGVRVPRSAILGAPGSHDDSWKAIDRSITKMLPLLSSYTAGALQRVMEFTNDYTSVRVLFGQPIGRFQRVQDHCIDLSIRADAVKWITYEALWRLDEGKDDALTIAHEAKAVAGDYYCEGVDFAHKVFAGPGTDFDHPLMPHSVACRSLFPFLGNSAYHRARMIDLILDAA